MADADETEEPQEEEAQEPEEEPPEEPDEEPPQETEGEPPQEPEEGPPQEPAEAPQEPQAGSPQVAEEEKKKNTIKKVQVKPGKLFEKEKDGACHYSTRLPALGYRRAPYTPIPYTFRVPSASAPVKINNLSARSPPFHVLLDHAISVIWTIFGSQEYDCPLGIAQLQWALAFLKTIRTRTWTYPPDVELCVDAVEEMLVDRYAELSKDIDDVRRLDGSVRYADGAFGGPALVTRTMPISINYADMEEKVERAEAHGTKSMTSTEAEEELEKLKKVAGVASIENLDGDKKDKAINILKMWKTDQVEKIKEELRRLREIEDKMKDIDDHFEGYIEDDMEVLLD